MSAELGFFICVYAMAVFLYWLRKQKSKPEIFTDTYFKNLAQKTIELSELSRQLEVIDNMIFDLQHVPENAEKQVTISIPDTLTNQANVGKFEINNVKDAEIYLEILISQRDVLRTSLYDGLNSALCNAVTETSNGYTDNTDNSDRGEENIKLYDHRRGECEI